jgi:anti-sigma regulatory factor (Ser/Thr protein kinase)
VQRVFEAGRAALSAWLEKQPHDDVLVEVAALLVSELVTNSVRHAQVSAGEPLRLSASLREATLRLELWDNGTGGAVIRRIPERRVQATGGYGLSLVEELSNHWGVERDPEGTTVWLELLGDSAPA